MSRQKLGPFACQICGCTDHEPCTEPDPERPGEYLCCAWIPTPPGEQRLCTFCAELATEAKEALLRGLSKPADRVEIFSEAEANRFINQMKEDKF